MTSTTSPTRRRTVRHDRRASTGRYTGAVTMGLGIVAIYLFLFLAIVARNPYDVWGGYALAPILLGIGLLILRRLLPIVESDPWIHRVVMFGLLLKLLGAFARFYTNQYLLGRGDAHNYHLVGSLIAAEFRRLEFDGPAFNEFVYNFTGTRFVRLLTAIPYVFTGPSHLGGYVIFSFFSFWGLYLFYRAYSIALPDGERRKYVVLLFFLPSMVFWPSSIGKEAWLTTMLGLGSYGLAKLLTQERFGYLTIFSAMIGMGIVRPHVAAIFGFAMAMAFVLRRSTGPGRITRKVLGLVLLAIAAAVVMNQVQAFFGLDSPLDAREVFDETARRSSQGGSQFETAQPTSIADAPWAVVTVLFRPFVFEAGSAAGLVTAMEGTLLLGLFVWNMPRLIRLPAVMVLRPYVGYAVLYSIVFAFSFSAVSNFGILARQRTQLFPIVTVLLAAPVADRPRTSRSRDRPESVSFSRRPSPRPTPSDSPPGSTDPVASGPERRYRNLSYRPVGAARGSPQPRSGGTESSIDHSTHAVRGSASRIT